MSINIRRNSRLWQEQKDIKIKVNLEECSFLGDTELMFQVWVNLLDNAIKFSNPNGDIDVKVAIKDNNINVTVRDYGVGMQEAEMEKIFERFYQEIHFSS